MGIVIEGLDETHVRVKGDITVDLAIDGDGEERSGTITVSDGTVVGVSIGRDRVWRFSFPEAPWPWPAQLDLAAVRLMRSTPPNPVASDTAVIRGSIEWAVIGGRPITG